MTRKTIDIAEASAHFSELLDDVEHGVFFLLKKNDKIIAEISPFTTRRIGLHTGSITTSEDFDDELPESFWDGK